MGTVQIIWNASKDLPNIPQYIFFPDLNHLMAHVCSYCLLSPALALGYYFSPISLSPSCLQASAHSSRSLFF
jgi:hypothetical protein